jgi:hypothetical protein
MVLAFSLQSDVKSIGAYAGFAAIIGLALLVLLYFAQAREVRRLGDLLEEQERRLAAAPVRTPGGLPAAAVTPARVVAVAPTPVPVAATPSATVAVPGVRRVAVATVAAAADEAVAAQAEPASEPVPAALGAATVAGALASSAAGVQAPGAGGEPADDLEPTPPGGAGDESVTVARPPVAPEGESAEEPGGGADDSAPPDPAALEPGVSHEPEGAGTAQAIPLSARPAATAEPAGGAALLDGPPVEPPPVEPFPAPGVSAFEPAPSVEISAERLEPSVFDHGLEAPRPGADDDSDPSAALAESAPLAPSTPAGARPRFPPPPSAGPPAASTAVPVAAASAGATGIAAAVANADFAAVEAEPTTRRRRRDGPPPGEGEEAATSSGASALRLLASAIVIVAVLIFIATRVFGGSSASTDAAGPSPATVTVAVLNGTHVGGLADRVASRLSRLGFKQGTVGNALSHGHHVTLVGYLAPAGRAAALEVAKDLAPTPTRVGPADAATSSLVEAAGTTPTVVVTLGGEYLSQ